MANRTVKDAKSIKGTNPQYLVEKIIRSRIYDSKYWKEECFALTAELLVDKGMELRYIGGVFGGNIKPTPFICLILKMLQIQPEKDIIVEFIRNDDFKYVRALGAFYMRLTGTSLDCFNYLEPLLNDNRKLRRQNRSGVFELVHVDEFIDELLREERACDIILPRIQKRYVLEETNEIQPRISMLEDDDDDDEDMDMDHSDNEGTLSGLSKKESKLSAKKDSGKSGERRRQRSDSESSDDERKRRRRNSRDRDRKPEKSESSKDKKRDRGKEDFGRSDRRRSRSRERERDRKERDRDRGDRDRADRSRDYDRDRDRNAGSSRGRDRDRSERHRDRGSDRDRHKSSRKHDW